ncbi:ABC transporter permease [Enterococcus malodoratus]|uniref:ABC transporter permease n=1 Tax=Enterococcus malodoratus TaxID=71451 RepID=UPI0020741602|nr:ABC transporter permease subunit [Enterococcus malodoratus]
MRKIQAFIKKYWITFLICVGFVFLYKYISDNKLFNALMFPPVEDIWAAFVKDRDYAVLNLLYSLKLLIPSIVVTLVIALGLGVLVGMNTRLREILHPIIYAFSCVPSILLSPFVVLLAPDFWWASVILIVYGTVWATLFATITGIQTIDKRYLDNAATLELHGAKKFFKVILPAASPSILSGFVNSLRSSFVMLVYAEMYGATYGLGFYVKRYSSLGIYKNMWGGFIFMVLVLVLVMQLFEKIKNRLLKWTID